MNANQVTNEKEFWAFMAKLSKERELQDQILKAQFAETDAKIAATDAQIKALAEQSNRTELQLAKTDAKLEKIAKLFGDASNNHGEEVEELFFTSLNKKPHIAGIAFDTIHRNLSGTKGKITDEFDIVLVNGDSLALIEVKSKAHLNLVDKMIEKKIPNLRTLFPMFKNYKIYAGIASLITYPELLEKATEKGLFLLTQQGKHLEIISPPLQHF